MERTYTIPLRKHFMKTSRFQRTNRAVSQVRAYLQRHMKTENVKLGEELNKSLWARGDSKPPSKVTVFVKKEDDAVYAELAGKDFKKKEFAQAEEAPKSKVEELASKLAGKKKAEPKAAEKAETSEKKD